MAPSNDIELDGADGQDQAEVMDETHLTEDGDKIANFDTMADVYDATRDSGDAEDDPVDADDYEPDDLDALEVDEDELKDDEDDPYEVDIGVNADEDHVNADEAGQTDLPGSDDIEGLRVVRDADGVRTSDTTVADFQANRLSDADIAALGYGDKAAAPSTGGGANLEDLADARDSHIEKNLDDGLEETFPASDPVSISTGAD